MNLFVCRALGRGACYFERMRFSYQIFNINNWAFFAIRGVSITTKRTNSTGLFYTVSQATNRWSSVQINPLWGCSLATTNYAVLLFTDVVEGNVERSGDFYAGVEAGQTDRLKSSCCVKVAISTSSWHNCVEWYR